MRDARDSNGAGAWGSILALIVALGAAGYLTYLAVDFLRSGCDCAGGSDVTAAGIAHAAVLIGGAAILYALVLVVGGCAAIHAMRRR